MAENYEYAEMLEIPVQTCTVSTKQKQSAAKKRKPKLSNVKEKVVEKVNETLAAEQEQAKASAEKEEKTEQAVSEEVKAESKSESEEVKEVVNETKANEKNDETENKPSEDVANVEKTVTVSYKPKKKITVIGMETVAIVALVLFIVITNLVMSNSGINTLLKMMNGTYVNKTAENNLAYTVFSATTPASYDKVSVKDGIITVNKSGSIYTPCDGTITDVQKIDGKITVEITHSTNFKTVISGMDFLYGKAGDKVYSNVPVGFLNKNVVTVSLYDKGTLITDYTISGNNIVWAV